jgi:hypothetical protein
MRGRSTRPFYDLIELASHSLVLMYMAASCHPTTQCNAISRSLFHVSGGWPALPVPSPAAISLVSTAVPLDPLGGLHDLRATISLHLQNGNVFV